MQTLSTVDIHLSPFRQALYLLAVERNVRLLAAPVAADFVASHIAQWRESRDPCAPRILADLQDLAAEIGASMSLVCQPAPIARSPRHA